MASHERCTHRALGPRPGDEVWWGCRHHKVTLVLKKGERHALIGPNDPGKTTLINQLFDSLTPLDTQAMSVS